MEFKLYDGEEHDSKLLDWFSDKALTPDSVQPYAEAIEEAYQDFKEFYGLDRDVDFVVAETDLEFLNQRYEEIPAWEYATGFSADPEFHDVEKPTVFIMLTEGYEYWKNILKYTIAHELAHQKYYEKRDVGWRIYQRMLLEGHAMHSAEELASEKNYNWAQEDWRPEKADAEKLLEELEKFNKWKDQEDVEVSGLFVAGGEKWPNAEGYPITYQVTKKLLNQKEIGVQDLLEISEEEWLANIQHIISELYE